MTSQTPSLVDGLYDYFIQTGILTLPGIGTFRLQRISAHTDAVASRMLPPSYTIRYQRRDDTPKRDMYDYLAKKYEGEDLNPVRDVNHLAFAIRTQLLQGDSYVLSGIGTLHPDMGVGFRFEPHSFQYEFSTDVRIQPLSLEGRLDHVVTLHEASPSTETEESLEMEGALLGTEDEAPVGRRRMSTALWMLCLLSLALILLRGYMVGYAAFIPRYSPFTPAEPPPTHTMLK